MFNYALDDVCNKTSSASAPILQYIEDFENVDKYGKIESRDPPFYFPAANSTFCIVTHVLEFLTNTNPDPSISFNKTSSINTAVTLIKDRLLENEKARSKKNDIDIYSADREASFTSVLKATKNLFTEITLAVKAGISKLRWKLAMYTYARSTRVHVASACRRLGLAPATTDAVIKQFYRNPLLLFYAARLANKATKVVNYQTKKAAELGKEAGEHFRKVVHNEGDDMAKEDFEMAVKKTYEMGVQHFVEMKKIDKEFDDIVNKMTEMKLLSQPEGKQTSGPLGKMLKP